MYKFKKIFLITILSLSFIFGMFSHQLVSPVAASQSLALFYFPGFGAQSPAPAPASPQAVQEGCEIKNGQEICSLENPIGLGQAGTTKATDIISVVIKTALGIIGALTLLMLVWGGFQWLTSAGSPEKVKSGTQTMVWAIIGVVLVFSSYILLSTFTSYLTVK